MLKLKPEVVGKITVPILDENNQETRIVLDENTSQGDLQKVYAVDACKSYFTEDSGIDAPAEVAPVQTSEPVQNIPEVIPPAENNGETTAEADEAGAGKKAKK